MTRIVLEEKVLWSQELDPDDVYRLSFELTHDPNEDIYYLGREDGLHQCELKRSEFKELMYAMMRHIGIIKAEE